MKQDFLKGIIMPSGIYKHHSNQVFQKGHFVSEETKKKIRQKAIGRKATKEAKENMRKNHADFSGKKHPCWKGGKVKSENRWRIWKPEHPFATKQGYIYRYRLVAEKILGRYLTKIEEIHHLGEKYPIDSKENKSDDRPENLYLFENKSKHMSYHGWKIKPKLVSNLI